MIYEHFGKTSKIGQNWCIEAAKACPLRHGERRFDNNECVSRMSVSMDFDSWADLHLLQFANC